MKSSLPTSGNWLLAQLFFQRNNVNLVSDEAGDKIIADLIPSIAKFAQNNDEITHFNWLRYSEGGNHLRLQLWHENADAIEDSISTLSSISQKTMSKFPESFSGKMLLTPLMHRLQEKSHTSTIHPPGTFLIGSATETGEEIVYEAPCYFDAVQKILALDSRLCTKIIARIKNYSHRAQFSQIFVLAVLNLLCHSYTDRTAISAYIANTWRRLFAISNSELEQTRKAFEASCHHIEALNGSLDARISVLSSINKELALELMSTIESIDDVLIATPLHRQSWPIFAMQALTILHQNQNRLGISMLEEICFTALLYRINGGMANADVSEAIGKANNAITFWEKAYV